MTEVYSTPGNNNNGVGLQGPVLLTDVEVDDAVSEAEEEEHLFANQLFIFRVRILFGQSTYLRR